MPELSATMLYLYYIVPLLAMFCEKIDSIAIEHYLTKIHTQKRKKRMSLCVQRYKQMLALLLLVVNSLAYLAVPWGHVPINYIRLVPWHYPPFQIVITWSRKSRPAIWPIRMSRLIKLFQHIFQFPKYWRSDFIFLTTIYSHSHWFHIIHHHSHRALLDGWD